jgi:hypothetical protein
LISIKVSRQRLASENREAAMISIGQKFTFLLLGIFCLATALYAERLPGLGDRPVAPVGVHPLILNSGYVFAGTVKAVEHIDPAGRGVGTTKITFHIDTAVRGVYKGQTLVISEWAGLWASGEKYRVGELVFLFLYPPSKLGLTSPVRGGAGKFRIAENGRVVVRPEQKGTLPDWVARTVGERREIEIQEFARAWRRADGE